MRKCLLSVSGACVLICICFGVFCWSTRQKIFKPEQNAPETYTLEFWIVKKGKHVQIILERCIITESAANAILSNRQSQAKICPIIIRISKEVNFKDAYSLLDMQQKHGFTNVTIRLNEDLSSRLLNTIRNVNPAPPLS